MNMRTLSTVIRLARGFEMYVRSLKAGTNVESKFTSSVEAARASLRLDNQIANLLSSTSQVGMARLLMLSLKLKSMLDRIHQDRESTSAALLKIGSANSRLGGEIRCILKEGMEVGALAWTALTTSEPKTALHALELDEKLFGDSRSLMGRLVREGQSNSSLVPEIVALVRLLKDFEDALDIVAEIALLNLGENLLLQRSPLPGHC